MSDNEREPDLWDGICLVVVVTLAYLLYLLGVVPLGGH